MAKLVSTLLGALWLTIVAGWIAVARALAAIEIRLINRIADYYVTIIHAIGGGGARTVRATWAEAATAAIEANRLLAPLIFSTVVIATFAILIAARRRWTA